MGISVGSKLGKTVGMIVDGNIVGSRLKLGSDVGTVDGIADGRDG